MIALKYIKSSGATLRVLAGVIGLACCLSSCFTGVESTPKITAREVRKQKVADSPEKLFLSDIEPQPTSAWRPGKVFLITDARVALIFERSPFSQNDSLAEQSLTLGAIHRANSISGEEQTVLDFVTAHGDTLHYRTNITPAEFGSRNLPLDIPFTVEASVVDEAARRMAGKTYYILQQRRLNDAGRDTVGLRYSPVTVTDVRRGDAYYPLRVTFTAEDGSTGSLMMTIGSGATSTRNFDTLFAFDDPRLRYPQISDENWQIIKESKVALGMTPLECRLALGSPNDWNQRPSTAGIVERWTYEDGVYLVFLDGVLTQFRK